MFMSNKDLITDRLKSQGWVLVTTPFEYNKPMIIRHSCGEEKVSTSLHVDRPVLCAKCSNGRIRDLMTIISKIDSYLKPLGLRVLWEETSYVNSETKLRIRCDKCGNSFLKSRILSERDGVKGCSICDGSNGRSIFNIEDYNSKLDYIAATQFNAVVVDFIPEVRGTVKRYLIRCLDCNFEYRTSLTVDSNKRVCPNCKHETNKFRSRREVQMVSWLRSLGITALPNYRSANNVEYDILLPDFNVALEFNGYFWHNSGSQGKPKDYHEKKTEFALSQGINLYHFWEDAEDSLVKSIILNKLGRSPSKIFARKCKVVERINPEFFDLNHVDGSTGFVSKQFNLLYEDEVVAALSVRKPSGGGSAKYRTSMEGALEIARFAVKQNYSVVGAYDKLLTRVNSWAVSEGYSYLVSYCNRDLSPDYTKTFYYKQGFKYVGSNLIQKYYCFKDAFKFKRGDVITRQHLQKHKVLQALDKHGIQPPVSMTEQQLCETYLNIVPVYNSGNFKFIRAL